MNERTKQRPMKLDCVSMVLEDHRGWLDVQQVMDLYLEYFNESPHRFTIRRYLDTLTESGIVERSTVNWLGARVKFVWRKMEVIGVSKYK